MGFEKVSTLLLYLLWKSNMFSPGEKLRPDLGYAEINIG